MASPDEVTASVRHFVATYESARHAKEFAENAERTTGATNVVRTGRNVDFDAPTVDSHGFSLYADVALSVGFYGGPRTKLNGRPVPRETY